MAATSGGGPQPFRHVAELDGVRALAIVAVMGLHAIDRLFPAGALGVDVFFTLSAFLITSLITSGEQRAGRFDFVRFYGRRAFRLFPALALWLCFVAAPVAVLVHQSEGILSSTVASVLYVANVSSHVGLDLGDVYAHAWSLSVEEQFYIIWPVVLVGGLLSMSPRRRRRWIVAGVVIAQGVAIAGGAVFSDNYFLPTGHLVPLALGVLAADYWNFGMPIGLQKLVSHPAVGALALVVLGFLFTSTGYTHWSLTATGLASAALILHVVVQDRSTASRLLRLQPVQWLGQRSYGLYLYHRTLAFVPPAIWPEIRLLYAGPLVILVSFLAAELSYRFVERPVRSRGNLWLDRRRSIRRRHA